jgi:anaerobic selenocysteine-containing dehydrogenase
VTDALKLPEEFQSRPGHPANKLTDTADVLLPGAAWAEKDGSWENYAGKIPAFAAAIPPPDGSRREGDVYYRCSSEKALYNADVVRSEMGEPFASIKVPRKTPWSPRLSSRNFDNFDDELPLTNSLLSAVVIRRRLRWRQRHEIHRNAKRRQRRHDLRRSEIRHATDLSGNWEEQSIPFMLRPKGTIIVLKAPTTVAAEKMPPTISVVANDKSSSSHSSRCSNR